SRSHRFRFARSSPAPAGWPPGSRSCPRQEWSVSQMDPPTADHRHDPRDSVHRPSECAGDAAINMTGARDVAAVAALALRDDGHAGKDFEVTESGPAEQLQRSMTVYGSG